MHPKVKSKFATLIMQKGREMGSTGKIMTNLYKENVHAKINLLEEREQ